MTQAPLKAAVLTPEAFQEFGAVLMSRGSVPQRDEFAANIENGREQAKPNLTFIHARAKRPVVVAVERHPYSSQTFVPVNGAKSLIVVCPSTPEGQPDLDRLQVFVAGGGQTVHYNAGTWHAPLCTLDQPGEYVMLRWDDGGADDTQLYKLDTPLQINVDSVLGSLDSL
jgi:ureidoglycolate lyase